MIPIRILTFLAILTLAGPALAELVIAPIGDSITQGDSNHKSYRYHLWKKLVDVEVVSDLAGSHKGHHNGDPSFPDYKGKDFDRDHEEHWGWRIDQILNHIDDWLGGYTPDIALVHRTLGPTTCTKARVRKAPSRKWRP
ncbi:MAG: hypothetical protein ACP5I4_03315 [Oceanipulchritudo sp.]